MSGLLMGMAFYVDLTISEKLTLLALCDHATDHGENVHPSIAKLAVKLRLGERAVQYNLARLERLGVIERVGKGGRGHASEFHINLDLLRAAYEKVHPSSPFPVKGAISPPERVQSPAERVQSDVEKGAISDPYLVSKKQPPLTTTVREPVSGKPDTLPLAREVLDWLNQKAGRTFRAVPANLDLVRARLRDGIADWQLKAIVSRKAREWGSDPKMNKYLRPATLFSKTNCEQYLGELPPPSPEAEDE